LREAEQLTSVDKDTLSKIERGLRHPYDVTLSKLAKGYGVPVEDLLEEPALAAEKAEAPPRGSRERVSASVERVRRVSMRVEDARRALLEAERLRETARPRLEEALARVEEARARVDEAQASLREQEAHLQEVRRVMDEVYDTELALGWAYGKAMMEEESPEGQRARRLRLASRKMVLFYEELVDLIRDAGVQVKRKDEGDVVAETEESVRPEGLELTVH
jgi:transcriptional regulator with XRE-family HTH domain